MPFGGWYPVPGNAVVEAVEGNPAELLGWAFVMRYRSNVGEWPSIREVSGFLGCGKTMASRLLGEVRLTFDGDAAAIEESHRNNPQTKGYIYAIASDFAVKIGFSVRPEVRLSALQTANASPLRLLSTWHGTMLDERTVHEQLKPWHLRGEWFANVPEVRAQIDQWATSG